MSLKRLFPAHDEFLLTIEAAEEELDVIGPKKAKLFQNENNFFIPYEITIRVEPFDCSKILLLT
jgi:hypothetical protein